MNQDDAEFIQRLVKTARELGIPVSVNTANSRKSHLFGVINPTNGKTTNLVRCLIEMGFTLQPGLGYQK